MAQVILVVDDEPLVLRVVAAALQKAGYVVLPAGSADEALCLARSHPQRIALLLADVALPRMSGPCVADKVAEWHPEAARLFMAGLPDTPEVRGRILGRGLPFLPKPFLPGELVEKVRETLIAHANARSGASTPA